MEGNWIVLGKSLEFKFVEMSFLTFNLANLTTNILACEFYLLFMYYFLLSISRPETFCIKSMTHINYSAFRHLW